MTITWNDKEVISATRNAVKAACKRGAEMVAADARRSAPKDSGDLAMSIKVEKSVFEDGGYLVTAQGPKAYDRFYATFVELGAYSSIWGRYSRKKKNIKDSPVHIAKQPFLRPALNKNKSRIRKSFVGILR